MAGSPQFTGCPRSCSCRYTEAQESNPTDASDDDALCHLTYSSSDVWPMSSNPKSLSAGALSWPVRSTSRQAKIDWFIWKTLVLWYKCQISAYHCNGVPTTDRNTSTKKRGRVGRMSGAVTVLPPHAFMAWQGQLIGFIKSPKKNTKATKSSMLHSRHMTSTQNMFWCHLMAYSRISEVPRAANIKTAVLWDATPCSLLDGH